MESCYDITGHKPLCEDDVWGPRAVCLMWVDRPVLMIFGTRGAPRIAQQTMNWKWAANCSSRFLQLSCVCHGGIYGSQTY